MYKIIRNYGVYEGWKFEDAEFLTAEDALVSAMKELFGEEFLIVKVVTFKEAPHE